MLYSPDARGLTDAINATGTVYEEIGNMHGEQVMWNRIIEKITLSGVDTAETWHDPHDGWTEGISWNDSWTTRLRPDQQSKCMRPNSMECNLLTFLLFHSPSITK